MNQSESLNFTENYHKLQEQFPLPLLVQLKYVIPLDRKYKLHLVRRAKHE